MAADRWRISESATGWSVFRSGKVVRYDCDDVEEALRAVKRKAGSGIEVEILDVDGNRSKKTTR